MNKLLPIALAAIIPSVHAAVSTLAVTGWDQDIVLNDPTPYNDSVTATMDNGLGNFDNWTWVEEGTYTAADGSDVLFQGFTAGVNTSLTGNGTFEFQSFTGSNALLLTSVGGSAATMVGTLSLVTPGSYSSLALYGSTAGGPTSALVTLTFSDSSTSDYVIASGTGIGTDWFNTNADRAVIVGGRASNRSEEAYTRLYQQTNDSIAINESLIMLSAADQAKTLESMTITNTGGGKMAVLAVSAEAVPEPSAAVLFGALGVLGLVRRRR
ncbi:PEP-CTERM sorting domain-containing protein [Haloferula sargassicola]|uniref:Ice-binding protein C-terminal domain-containing protein n=1 Tax=Haloferula sargassicola TaxID=490096 RepID=A0ABP9UKA3_9BACT